MKQGGTKTDRRCGKFFIFQIALLLCACSAPALAATYHVDPVNGNDQTVGGPYKTFGPLCGQNFAVAATVLINSTTVAASVPASCSLSTIGTIGCEAESCALTFGASGSFLISRSFVTSSVTFLGVGFLSTSSSSVPLLSITGQVSVVLDSLNGATASIRNLASVSSGGSLTIQFCDRLVLALNSSITLNAASLTIMNSTFSDSLRLNTAFISAVDSYVVMDNAIFRTMNYQSDNAALGGTMILNAVSSDVVISGSGFYDLNMRMNVPVDHPNMISVRSGTLAINGTTFSNLLFEASLPSNIKLGSVVSLQETTYNISFSNFLSVTSPGCACIHAATASGEFTNSTISSARMYGTPMSGPSEGTTYPPFEYPGVSAAVCVVRNLSTLQADYGAFFTEASVGRTWNLHAFRFIQFIDCSINTTSPYVRRKLMSEIEPSYPLYATNIWASNVKLVMENNAMSIAGSIASVRTDACELVFVSLAINGAGFSGWVDFGSTVLLTTPIQSFSPGYAAIYGAAPVQPTRFDGEVPGSFIVFNHLTIPSVITGGQFLTVKVNVVGGSKLVLGSTFGEYERYDSSTPPFVDILQFGSEFQFNAGTEVILARTTSPVEMLGSAVFDVLGTLTVPRLSSSDALNPSPAIIKCSTAVKIQTTGLLRIVDLIIEGGLNIIPGTSTQLLIDPSLHENTFHGLNVNGTLSCANALPVKLDPWLNGFTFLFGPFSNHILAPGQTIPVVKASSMVATCVFAETDITMLGYGTFSKSGTLVPAARSFKLSLLEVNTIWHPTGRAVFLDFPTDVSKVYPALGNGCGMIMPSSTSADICHWQTPRRLRWTSATLTLTPTHITTLQAKVNFVIPEHTYLPHLNSTAFVQTDFNPTSPAGVTLDARSSTASSLTPTTTITRSVSPSSPTLEGLFTGAWSFNVPTSALTVGTTYTFTAMLTVNWHSRTMANATLTTTPTAATFSTTYCEQPSIRIDASTTVYYYEDTSPTFSILFDPYCTAIPPRNTISWTLTYPDLSQITSGVSTPYFQFPRISRPDLTLGDEMKLTATVSYINGEIRSSSISLIFKASEPVFISSRPYESNLIDEVSIQPVINPSLDSEETEIQLNQISCPEPAYSILMGPPYSDLAPFTYGKTICSSDTSSTLYEPEILSSVPNGFSVLPSSVWHSRDHAFALRVRTERTDGSAFETTLSTSIVPRNPTPSVPGVQIDFARSLNRQYPYQWDQPSVGSSLMLSVRFTNGSVCYGCIYEWLIDGVARTTFSSILTVAQRNSDVNMNYRVTVSVPTPSGGVEIVRAQFATKTGRIPFGGIYDTLVVDMMTSRVSIPLQGWASNYPNLRSVLVLEDCHERIKLLRYPGLSPLVEGAIPRTSCSSMATKLYILDGIDGVNVASIATFSTWLPPLNWTNGISPVSDFIYGLVNSSLSGDINSMLTYLNDLEQLICAAETAEWTTRKSEFVPMIADAIGRIVGAPYAEFMVSSFSNTTLLEMVQSKALYTHLLEIISNAPFIDLDALSNTRARSAMFLLDSVLYTFFSSSSTESYVQKLISWLEIPKARQIFDFVHSSLGFPSSSSYNFARMSLLTGSLDRYQIAPVEVPWDITFSASVLLGAIAAAPPLLPYSVWLIPSDMFPLTVERLLPAYPSVYRMRVSYASLSLSDAWVQIYLPYVLPSDRNLVCGSIQGNGLAWSANCVQQEANSGSGVNCRCPLYSLLPGASVSISLLRSEALCLISILPGPDFVCQGGQWTAPSSITQTSISLPSGSVVTVLGNLTVDTISFNGLGSSVNVTGCTKIGTQITIELTLAELEALIASGEITTLLLTTTGCDISDLKNIPISVTVNSDRCEKVSVTSESTTTTLSGVFKIDDSGCKKKSSTWWIVLVSVLGGIIIVAIIITLLATLTPLKHIVRPHAKRSKASSAKDID